MMDALSNAFSSDTRQPRNLQLNTAISALRREIVDAGEAATTGRVADPVSHLGSGNGTRLSLEETARRADAIAVGNDLLAVRLKATQDTLGQFGQTATDLSQSLITSVSGATTKEATAKAAERALATMRDVANTTFSGRTLLGGDRGDRAPVKAMDDARASFEAVFAAHFGFGSGDPAAATLSTADVVAFLTGTGLPALQGGIWTNDISLAGASVTTRIAPGASISLGPTADDPAMRAGFAGAIAMAHLAGSALSQDAVQAAAGVALDTLAQSGSDIAAARGELGLDEARVEQASERLIAQGERMRESSSASVAVDAFEAAARFAELATQLEAAYTMTTRIYQLTLLRFLP